MKPRLRTAAFLFLASVGFQLSFIFLDAFLSDEGVVLVAASDLANGKHLYTDFYTPVTPAVYLLQGIAFKLLGSSFAVSRLLMCSLYAACVVLVFAIAQRQLPRLWATAAAILAIPLQVWMWPHAHFFSYNALAIFFCLLALERALAIEAPVAEGVEGGAGRRRRALMTGAALGLALWTKPNLAAAVGAGILVYWLSGWLRTAAGLPTQRPRGFAVLLHEGIAILAGMLATSLPFIGYLVATDALGLMFESLVALSRVYGDVPEGLFPALFPLTAQFDAVRINPNLVVPGMISTAVSLNPAYQDLLNFTGLIDFGLRVAYYAPIAMYVSSAALLLNALRRKSWTQEHEAALLTVAAGVCLLATIAPHPAMHYLTPTLLPGVATAVFLFYRASQLERRSISIPVQSLGAVAAAAYLMASLAAVSAYVSKPRDPVHTPRGTIWIEPGTARALSEVLEHAVTKIEADAEIFAVPHFPMFYFLAERPHPTPYTDLRPGSPGVGAEEEIIRRLEEDQVEWVLRLVGSPFKRLQRFEVAYPRLHRYIETQYETTRVINSSYGEYAEYMHRRQ